MMTRISTLKNHERFHQASVGSKQKARRDEKENASFGIKANNKKCFLIMGNSTPIRNVCVCVRSYKTPVRMSVSCTQRSSQSSNSFAPCLTHILAEGCFRSVASGGPVHRQQLLVEEASMKSNL